MPGVMPVPAGGESVAEYPDLSAARAEIERHMIDRVRITFTEDDPAETPLDEQTGQLVEPEPTLMYEGKGKIRASNQAEREQVEGGSPSTSMRFTVAIPISAPAIPIGSHIEVLSSVRDLSLVGRKMLVVAAPGGTYAVQRKMLCEEAVAVERVRP